MVKKESFIKPGMNVDCVVKLNEDKKVIDVRKATVFDLDNKIMIISQATPAIPPSFKGHRITITHVNKEDNIRIGLSGKIFRIVDDYMLSSSERVGAIYLSDLSEEKKDNMRFAYRVRPPENCGLTLYNSQQEPLEVIDISGLGVRFSHNLTREYKVDQELKLYLGFDQVFYELKARVVRKDAGAGAQLNKFEYVAVQFLDLDYRTAEELYRIVRKIDIKKRSNKAGRP